MTVDSMPSVPPDSLETITATKVTVAVLVKCYWTCFALRYPVESYSIPEEFRGHIRRFNDLSISDKRRKLVCLFLLKLVQGTDMSLSTLVASLLDPKNGVPYIMLSMWRRELIDLMAPKSVGGVMDLMASLGRLVQYDGVDSTLHRSSVFGLFIRRLVLFFNRMSFMEVSHLYRKIESYYNKGKGSLRRLLVEAGGQEETTLQISDDSESESMEDSNKRAESGQKSTTDNEVRSRKQAELYIAQQVELLQHCDRAADSPSAIQATVKKIHESNPEMIEGYFLSYLNCLRVNEFSSAFVNLSMGVNMTVKGNRTTPQCQEEISKGFRFAALNLSALHARFEHNECALAALREAIMTAQEASDHVCLQHALGWLLRIAEESPESQQKLLENLIANCGDLQLNYLKALGLQTLAQFTAAIGGHPRLVLDRLVASDIISSQSSFQDVLSLSLAQKSSIWALYGRSRLSLLMSQLLLNMDTSDPLRLGNFLTTEPYAMALCNVARYLFDSGHAKACDKVLHLASSVFPNPSSTCGALWGACRLEIAFRKSLHVHDWVGAARRVQNLRSIDPREADFLQVTLALWRGDAAEMNELMSTMRDGDIVPKYPVAYRVRFYLLEAEYCCLSGSYSNAITPLLSALPLCRKNNLQFLEALVLLHVAHVTLHLEKPEDALTMTEALLPIFLSQNDQFECGRAHLLIAKCHVTASNNLPRSEKKAKCLKAVAHMKQAIACFTALDSHHRIKDVLYMMARLFHALDKTAERNHASAAFKKIEEQHPSCITSKIAQML